MPCEIEPEKRPLTLKLSSSVLSPGMLRHGSALKPSSSLESMERGIREMGLECVVQTLPMASVLSAALHFLRISSKCSGAPIDLLICSEWSGCLKSLISKFQKLKVSLPKLMNAALLEHQLISSVSLIQGQHE